MSANTATPATQQCDEVQVTIFESFDLKGAIDTARSLWQAWNDGRSPVISNEQHFSLYGCMDVDLQAHIKPRNPLELAGFTSSSKRANKKSSSKQ